MRRTIVATLLLVGASVASFQYGKRVADRWYAAHPIPKLERRYAATMEGWTFTGNCKMPMDIMESDVLITNNTFAVRSKGPCKITVSATERNDFPFQIVTEEH